MTEPFGQAQVLGQVRVTIGDSTPYVTPAERQASALERIAAALEKLTEHHWVAP